MKVWSNKRSSTTNVQRTTFTNLYTVCIKKNETQLWCLKKVLSISQLIKYRYELQSTINYLVTSTKISTVTTRIPWIPQPFVESVDLIKVNKKIHTSAWWTSSKCIELDTNRRRILYWFQKCIILYTLLTLIFAYQQFSLTLIFAPFIFAQTSEFRSH